MTLPERLLQMGYAFVCAHCAKLHRPAARGLRSCEAAMGTSECGGPLSGRAFPEYEGPLTRQSIADLCFRCGERSENLVQVGGAGFVGACKEHVEMLRPQSGKAMVPVKPEKQAG
jgi:hypothetical protein